MSWTAHYFDRRLNSDGVSRAFASKEDALVAACDLMRRNCVVNFVQGPNDEKNRRHHDHGVVQAASETQGRARSLLGNLNLS